MDSSVLLGLLFSWKFYDSVFITRDLLELEIIVVAVTDDKTLYLLESVLSFCITTILWQTLFISVAVPMQFLCLICIDLINPACMKSCIFCKQCMILLEAFESTREKLPPPFSFTH